MNTDLQNSEDRYRRLLEAVTDYVYTVSVQNGYAADTVHGAGCVAVTGYTPEEFRQNSHLWIQMVDEKDRQMVEQHAARILAGKAAKAIEHRIVRKDGRLLWVRNTPVLHHDQQGKLVSYDGLIRDITEQKRLEKRQQLTIEILELLNRSGKQAETTREILRLIKEFTRFETIGIRLKQGANFPYYAVNTVTEGVLRTGDSASLDNTNDDGRFESLCRKISGGDMDFTLSCFTEHGSFWINSAAALHEIHGGENLLPLLRPDSAGEPYESAALIPLRSDDEIIGLLLFHDHRSGMLTPDLIRFFEGIGASIGIALIRKHDVEALRQAEERVRTFIENAEDMIYFQRTDGAVVLLNNANKKITGYALEEFQANPQLWRHILAQEDIDVAQAFVSRAPKSVSSFNIEYRIRRKDGTRRWILSHRVSAKDAAGQHIGYNCIDRDITERKEIELALKQERESLSQRVAERTLELQQANAELARSARLKDEFLANMSHELRTPLNTVLGMVEVLQEEVYGALNTKQIVALRSIEESARHLLSLINDILDLSKINAQKFELNITDVSIEAVTQSSLQFIKQLAQKKHITVLCQIDKTVRLIQADERRLKQVLVNLLSNAVKFTPEGGQIGLEMTADANAELVYFTVWDTGIGIAEKDVQYLFQPFVQLNGTLSREHAGTGLGLSLVEHMTKLHGGQVSVESRLEKGSRFTISLPWKPTERSAPEMQVAPHESDTATPAAPAVAVNADAETSEHPLILIAEDHEANITTISEYLIAKGYRISIARNGKEAIKRTFSEHPAIIIMDIQMPEMDGLDAIRNIRSDEYMRELPIIAVTALTMPGDRERCLAAGANEYLSKPVGLRKLDTLIRQLLAKQ